MVVTFAELLAEQLNDPKVDQSIKIFVDVLNKKNNKKEKEDGVNMDNILENVIDEIVANVDSLD